jgi:NAD(P)-dependent dehydrogenase (short-subunit alcohol dehydrogenase family)
MQRVILVTGASSGFGLVTARLFQRRGWRVFGTTRAAAGAPAEPGIEWLEMDVHSDASVAAAASMLFGRAGRIDALFNNAGVAMLGAVEETSVAEAKVVFETNVFGVLRVTQAVLPAMRAQRSGHIVMMSSLSGFFGVPFHGAYAASKHAIEALAQALRLELEPYGIRVASIEPEAHRTGIRMLRPARPLGHYDGPRAAVGGTISQQIAGGPDPENVARLAYRIVTSKRVPYRFPTGRKAQLLRALIRILPDAAMDRIAKRTFRMS